MKKSDCKKLLFYLEKQLKIVKDWSEWLEKASK
jgi:hypothetical protein